MKKDFEQEVLELIGRVQEQLFAIEKKLDNLISRPAASPVEKRPFVRSFERSDRGRGRDDRGSDDSPRERTMHRAICAECRKECEVPFRPSGERPVYCRECFSKHREDDSYGDRPDKRRGRSGEEGGFRGDGRHGGKKKFFENKKFYDRKRPDHKRKRSKR